MTKDKNTSNLQTIEIEIRSHSLFPQYLKILPKKLSKREIKKEFKTRLNKWTQGLTSSSRYAILKSAKEWSDAHNLEFPDWAQREMTIAAKEWLMDAIEFNHNLPTQCVQIVIEQLTAIQQDELAPIALIPQQLNLF